MVKRVLIVVALFGAVAAGVAYQAVARDRAYRRLLGQAGAALMRGETFGAIEAYSGAIGLRPDSLLAHLRRGETYQRRGDLDNAARDFMKAAGLDPAAFQPLEALGDVRYAQGRFADAAEAYEGRLRLDDSVASVTYKLALARYRDGALEAALASLDAALRLNAESSDAAYLLGMTLRESGRQAEAIDAFEKAVALSPGMIPAREELADLYRRAGRRREEVAQLQVLAALDRDDAGRQVAVGLAHARGGQWDVAVLTLGNALEQAADQAPVYGALGRVWLEIASTRADRPDAIGKALEAFARAAARPDATSDLLTLYGRALIRDNRLEDAARVLRRATTRFPVDPSAFLEQAALAERSADLQTARSALVAYAALTRETRDVASRAERIAELSLRLGDPGTAVAWLQRAADAKPDDLRLRASLAEAQARAGALAASR